MADSKRTQNKASSAAPMKNSIQRVPVVKLNFLLLLQEDESFASSHLFLVFSFAATELEEGSSSGIASRGTRIHGRKTRIPSIQSSAQSGLKCLLHLPIAALQSQSPLSWQRAHGGWASFKGPTILSSRWRCWQAFRIFLSPLCITESKEKLVRALNSWRGNRLAFHRPGPSSTPANKTITY